MPTYGEGDCYRKDRRVERTIAYLALNSAHKAVIGTRLIFRQSAEVKKLCRNHFLWCNIARSHPIQIQLIMIPSRTTSNHRFLLFLPILLWCTCPIHNRFLLLPLVALHCYHQLCSNGLCLRRQTGLFGWVSCEVVCRESDEDTGRQRCLVGCLSL